MMKRVCGLYSKGGSGLFTRVGILTFIAGYLFIQQSLLYSQTTKMQLPTKTPKQEEAIQLGQDSAEYTKMSICIGGGYFMPGETESTMIDNSWAIKIMFQQNNIQKTVLGLGADISYTKLPDKEYDGSITYITALPVVTLTLPLYNSFCFQAKAGPGLSVILSKINTITDSSLSMTLSAGSGLFVIIKNFILGCEGMYHYYFQIHSSSSKSVYGYAGYLF